MNNLEELKKERKLFEEWIYHKRKKEWFHAHANLEREPDPDPQTFKGKLGRYSDQETEILWDFWQYDSSKLKYLFTKVTHNFDYSKEIRSLSND